MTPKDTHQALVDLGYKPQRFADGAKIQHKFRRGVIGVVKIVKGDYAVKWSDRGDNWEILHSGDVGRPA